MTTDQSNELRKLAQAANDLDPGEWTAGNNQWAGCVLTKATLLGRDISLCVADCSALEAAAMQNTAYIAAANPAAILALIQQRDELLAALELFMERVDEPPEANCSCHISPPCNDCVENWGLREAFSDAKAAISKAEAKS